MIMSSRLHNLTLINTNPGKGLAPTESHSLLSLLATENKTKYFFYKTLFPAINTFVVIEKVSSFRK